MVAQIQPQIGGDLVVAAAPGPQLPAERAEAFEQPPFKCGVHVLVGDGRTELALADEFGQFIERKQQPGGLVVGEQPGVVQHPRMRLGREQVVGRQPPVEVHRHREFRKRLRGAAGEAAAPQPGGLVAHWCTIRMSLILDGLVMRPRCRLVIALLA